MTSRIWPLALAFFWTAALANSAPAMTLAQEARWLIGREYSIEMNGELIAPEESTCTEEGGSMIQINGIDAENWSIAEAQCQGRRVILLTRLIGQVNPRALTWRIVDTLVLPPYERDTDPARLNALRLFGNGDCELDGKTNTSLIALIRFGKREKINWRTGVERAWTFDTARGRIVPLSTRRVVCYMPEPA